LASLVESADKVANTASVYGAFLKHIKKSASKEYQRFKADKTENRNHKANSTYEYLHINIYLLLLISSYNNVIIKP